jgi:putative transferase (TIGR04331 family)
MLEALTLDIPFIAFWSNGLDHLRESAVPLYQSLVDVGIIHFTPESASDKVKEVWSDIPEWWNQESVQLARKEFCRNYARKSKKPLRELKKLMKT